MKRRTDWLVLLICLLVAVFVWWQFSRQEFKAYTISINTLYSIPDSLRIINDVPEKLAVQFQMRPPEYNRFLKNSQNQILRFELGSDSLQVIRRQQLMQSVKDLFELYEVKNLNLDSESDIRIRVERAYFKKVAIKLASDLNFYPGFEIADSIKLSPDSVFVYGPKEIIDTLSSWPTEAIKLENIRDDISQLVKLHAPSGAFITLNPTFVDLFIPVDQFTEKELWIEIKLSPEMQMLQKSNFKILPSVARIFAKTSVEGFNQLTEKDFDVIVKVNSIKEGKKVYPIEVTRKPDFVKEVKLYPKSVELILHQ